MRGDALHTPHRGAGAVRLAVPGWIASASSAAPSATRGPARKIASELTAWTRPFATAGTVVSRVRCIRGSAERVDLPVARYRAYTVPELRALTTATGLPLKIRVFAKGAAAPALDTRFLDLDLAPPAPEVTAFDPPSGATFVGYTILAKPLVPNQTGIRGFCAEEDAVVRVDPLGACSNAEATILTFNALNQ